MKKFGRITATVIESAFILAGLFVFLLSVSHPMHNLIPSQMVIGILVSVCVAVGLYFLLDLIGKKIPFIYSYLFFIILSVLWGIALYAIGVVCRSSTVSFFDYEVCYRAALEYARSGSISDVDYFMYNPHNWKSTLVLSGLLKTGMRIGFSDPYYFLLAVNVILLLAAMLSCRYIVAAAGPERKVSTLFVFPLFASFLPVYAYVQSFYSDGASFCFPICGIALFYFSYRLRTKFKYVLLFLSGMIMGFGYLMKVTALICIIAVIICLAVYSGILPLKKMIPAIIAAVAGFIAVVLLMEAACMKSSWYREKDIYSTTAITYIAMGLKNDGTYYENREFRDSINAMTYTSEKDESSKEYIKENLDSFFDPDHIVAKTRANYASGNLGAEDFARYAYGEDTVLNRIFNNYGDLYWYGCKYNMIWLFQIWLAAIIAAVINLFSKDKKYDLAMSVFELTFLGYFIFLFFWEANNRQLYNMMPVAFAGYVLSLSVICDLVKKAVHYRPKKNGSEKD